MVTLEKSILIHAPVEKVFSYMEDPTHMLELSSYAQEIKDVQRQPNGAPNFRGVMKVAGIRLEAAVETTEYVPNAYFVQKTKSGATTTSRWSFQAEDGGTRVTMTGAYLMPIPLLGKIAEAVAARQNEHELERMLANLKARMEA